MKGKILCSIIILSCVSHLIAQECVVEEETRIIKTYPFFDPDPLPILARRPALYPYFAFNGYNVEGVDRPWKVVRMENDYIEVLVLPQVGGKVYGAKEKATGKAFIYMNDVIKFRQIALRGPWTSGGIEFNFGIVGHTPATAAAVDYLVRENDDGSVSCVVGAMDLPSRTRWSVEIRLPKDKAYFETRSLWYNPTPFNQSYYVWMNNAIKTGDDLQYFYPGRFMVPHGYSTPPVSWPVDDAGRDRSWYRNNDFGGDKSYFIFGEYANFYGAYWHDEAFGFGHWALYDDMPGKKMWIWALSRLGGIWEGLLTDRAGQYSEPQAGRLLSQSDHAFFAPYSGDSWKEILFPFKETGGLVDASPLGALNVVAGREGLDVSVCALQEIDDDLIVTRDGREIHREHIALKPMEVFKRKLDVDAGGGTLRISLSNKLYYSSDSKESDVDRPLDFHRFDESTAEGLYLAGDFFAMQRQYDAAMKRYGECLKREPLHTRALVRLAEMHGRRAEYEKGLQYASKALANVMYDPAANYVYGVLSRYLGNLVDAKETFGWAARSLEYRSNAYCQIAEILVKEGNLELAGEYASRSLEFNKYNLAAYEVLAVILRKRAKPDGARDVLEELLRLDPLNHLARFELFLLDPSDERLDRFKSMIRNELPHESYLEMALFYAKLGCEREAVRMLEEAPPHPMVYFGLAYLLRERDPKQSKSCLEMGGSLSARLVFPFREESMPVLEWVCNRMPKDWKPRYYLGLILWGKGRRPEALELFDSCGDPDYAPFHLALGHLDGTRRLACFEKALSLDEGDWRNWHYPIREYNNSGEVSKALEISERAVRKFPGHMVLSMDHATSLFNNKRYEECLGLLEKTEVLPYEGAWEAHDLFVRVQVYLAMESMKRKDYGAAVRYLEGSKEYPERLGTGAPFDPDYRLQDYLLALCYESTGDGERAEQARRRILDYTVRNGAKGGRHHYFGLLVLQERGEGSKAAGLLEDLEMRHQGSLEVAWYKARYAGDGDRAREIEEKRKKDPRFKLTVEVVRFLEDAP